MHLLFATSIVPDGALASGYEIANAAIIAALRRAGARVTVIGFIWPGKAAADPENTIVLGAVDVRTENASALQKLAWVGKAVLSGLTFASAKLRAVSDAEVLAAIERAGPFDGYVLNSVQFAGAFEKLFDERPSIFVAHNVEHLSARENAAAAPGIFQRLLFRREARLLESVEERLCRRARFVFTLAEEDRSALGAASDDRSAVLPLVTGARPPAHSGRRRIECDAALIGTWTWQPNRIGLGWFLDKVVPHLRPDFRIRIAGSIPSDIASTHPGVAFVGRVPDAQAFIRGGAVIPLISTAGSGVQLKTIETFELGLPAVATSHALRGIDHRPVNCAVTDDPVAFAKALEAAAADITDVDGSAFHRRQLKALDAAIRFGLEKLGPVMQEAFA
ncbi:MULTISPECIES: glycosyltransferase family 4 protein [unclassified Mesorhizobium]|uniref:glycosyltransferase family 4 protein n=1 Tax=unclassified Mesorhizobium TaxID=325217 RepID=UPI00112AB54F|nr:MULTISPECIES: glycosyltransferase family 4 protein [unclassified Mesorhizobium]MCA0003884.1 glycosyltransferase family 4 protein [Mesorhizobium sp. B264B2A]MCA0005992.1 glycosyltransferase family 4 protein [Mesorhizobium sp. B264B1B]MCA0022031.1 glycosyltransferase family 4 protein [Mesorhizobium sp. B264B1A]TPJ48294.1 glycosyltransferase [Mesorhizobium sp. B2-6-6]